MKDLHRIDIARSKLGEPAKRWGPRASLLRLESGRPTQAH